MVQQNLTREVFLVAFQPFIEKYSQRMYVLAIFNDIVMVLNDIQCILPVILSNPDSRWPYLPEQVCTVCSANWGIAGQLGGFSKMHSTRAQN